MKLDSLTAFKNSPYRSIKHSTYFKSYDHFFSSYQDKEITFALPSFPSKLVDSTGTGDALLSYATLSMIATKSLVISSILGSLAGACECEKDGNIAITPEEILKKINLIEESSNYKIRK